MTGAWHAPVSMADKESVDVRSEVHRPQERIAPQGARVLLMDGMAVESAFALLLTKVTKEGLVPDTSRTTNVREGS